MLLDRCQCDESVHQVEDKPWTNEELINGGSTAKAKKRVSWKSGGIVQGKDRSGM